MYSSREAILVEEHDCRFTRLVPEAELRAPDGKCVHIALHVYKDESRYVLRKLFVPRWSLHVS